jgi:hypothetical protein
MAQSRGARSVFATAIGYGIVVLIAFFVLRLFVGALFGLIRAMVVLVVIGALVVLYLRLKLPGD